MVEKLKQDILPGGMDDVKRGEFEKLMPVFQDMQRLRREPGVGVLYGEQDWFLSMVYAYRMGKRHALEELGVER